MRFTIRDILWLTIVVAVGVSWWADRKQLYADKVQAENDSRDFWISTITKDRLDELQRKYAAPQSDN